MTTSDIARLQKRIDEVVEKLGDLSNVVANGSAGCEACRPFVLGGNGKPPLSDRLGTIQQAINEVQHGLSDRIAALANDITALKTAREISRRVFWAAIGVVGTISGTIVACLLKWWFATGG